MRSCESIVSSTSIGFVQLDLEVLREAAAIERQVAEATERSVEHADWVLSAADHILTTED